MCLPKAEESARKKVQIVLFLIKDKKIQFRLQRVYDVFQEIIFLLGQPMLLLLKTGDSTSRSQTASQGQTASYFRILKIIQKKRRLLKSLKFACHVYHDAC